MGLFSFMTPKNKYHQEEAKLDNTNYGGTIGQAAGNAQQVYGQQQGLVGQLGDVAAGKGPNPAQEMLRQQTGQNINTAAGQAASQRSVNPALAARMAVDTGAQLQQNAAGQGATLQAQQSLGALGQQGQVLQGMGQNQNQLFGTSGQLQNQQNQGRIANTLGAGAINAGVAAQNAQMEAGVTGGIMNGLGGMGAMMLGPAAPVAAAAAPAVGAAYGGEIPGFAQGGMALPPLQSEFAPAAPMTPPLHSYMDSLSSLHAPAGAEGMSLSPGPLKLGGMSAPPPAAAPNYAGAGGAFMKGLGTGMAKDSLGAYDRFSHMRTPGLTMNQGGPVDFTGGGQVPGQPPVPDEDTPENDVVPAMVTPKEIVLPLSVTQSDNAPEAAASFVAHLLRGRGDGYGKVLAARGMAEGGAVQDPEHFQRRQLPPEEPLGRTMKKDIPVPESGYLPVPYLGDSPRTEVERKRTQGFEEGGVVKSEPGFIDSVKGWWAARGTPDEDAARQQVDEAANAALPGVVSGRAGVKKYRDRLKQADEAAKE